MSVLVAMSAALETIFSFEKSRKWIIREGLTGISRSGSGAPIASGGEEGTGVSHERVTLVDRFRVYAAPSRAGGEGQRLEFG